MLFYIRPRSRKKCPLDPTFFVLVSLSGGMYKFGSHSTVFIETIRRRLTLKYLDRLQIKLKFDKIFGHFNRKPELALLSPTTSNPHKMVRGSQHRQGGKEIKPTRHNVTLNCIVCHFRLPIPFSEVYVLKWFTLLTAFNSSARLQLHYKMVVFTCPVTESYYNPGKKE